jgi:hypothetical protein
LVESAAATIGHGDCRLTQAAIQRSRQFSAILPERDHRSRLYCRQGRVVVVNQYGPMVGGLLRRKSRGPRTV